MAVLLASRLTVVLHHNLHFDAKSPPITNSNGTQQAMEPAILGVVLDSSVVIEAERRRLDVAHFLKHIATQIGEREAALCSISVVTQTYTHDPPEVRKEAKDV